MLGYILFISIAFGQQIIWMKCILATLFSQILYICQLFDFSFTIIDNSLIMDFVAMAMKICWFWVCCCMFKTTNSTTTKSNPTKIKPMLITTTNNQYPLGELNPIKWSCHYNNKGIPHPYNNQNPHQSFKHSTPAPKPYEHFDKQNSICELHPPKSTTSHIVSFSSMIFPSFTKNSIMNSLSLGKYVCALADQ